MVIIMSIVMIMMDENENDDFDEEEKHFENNEYISNCHVDRNYDDIDGHDDSDDNFS